MTGVQVLKLSTKDLAKYLCTETRVLAYNCMRAVARTLEPAPWQEGAERRSSAKKAAIPDSRSMPALPRLGRPGSVPPGRSSAPIHAGDSPDSD